LHEELNLPLPRKPNNSTSDLPCVFVGDEAFALHKDFLKPFSQKQLANERNYRLSRARRIIENKFGIMASRFRDFHTEINLKLKRIETVVLSCCVLHNVLHRSCNSYAADVQDEFEEEQSDILAPLQRGHNRHAGERGQSSKREVFTLL